MRVGTDPVIPTPPDERYRYRSQIDAAALLMATVPAACAAFSGVGSVFSKRTSEYCETCCGVGNSSGESYLLGIVSSVY